MTHLDTMLDAETQSQLVALGLDVTDVAFKLANTLPNIISVPLNMNESRTVLAARVTDIVGAMENAAMPTLPEDREAWLAGRGTAPTAPGHGPSGAVGSSGTGLALVPPEVPTLPESTVSRPDLISALKKRVLNPEVSASPSLPMAGLLPAPSTSSPSVTTVTAPAKQQKGSGGFLAGLRGNATAAAGMGGVGKTMIAATLARDEEVRAAFDRICWVSVGQEPDTKTLQQTLYRQLVNERLSASAAEDELVALGALKEAAKPLKTLLILDDVWVTSHATALNFVDDSDARSAVVVTTRIRSLIDGVAEVSCGTLSKEASLELLLRTGGCEALLDDPPAAALEAVELCGRLPLALGIAGGIIEELADSWQTDLTPLLKDEFGEESVEERVVTASLRAVPSEVRAAVESMFQLHAIFAEDTVVPAVVIDVVAPLAQAAGSGAKASSSGAQQKRHVRRCLQQLLKGNIMRGSVESGVSVHDLVRDCMIRRAEAAREGGLRATQREVLPLLLAAFDASGPAAEYVAAALHWHVQQARQPEIDLHKDALLMRVLTHESSTIRKQGAIGLGVDELQDAAQACEAGGAHLEAAQLLWATQALRGNASGAVLRQAFTSLQKAGDSNAEMLELRVLSGLIFATDGAPAVGTAEHKQFFERIKELASRPELAGSDAMEANYALGNFEFFSAFAIEGIGGRPGPMTIEMLQDAHRNYSNMATLYLSAAAAAPSTELAVANRACLMLACFADPRQHTLPQFDLCYPGGDGKSVDVRPVLRESIELYSFETFHPPAKQLGICADHFMSGLGATGLLLFYGDLAVARAGFAKCVAAHGQVLRLARQGKASAPGYAYELVTSILFLVPGLMALGDASLLRTFMSQSLAGAFFEMEAVKATFDAFVSTWTWMTEEGHVHSTTGTYELCVRGLAALVEEGTNASRDDALREWLPSTTELLRITEYECAWLGHTLGANHPALLCARLHGERLGNWEAAVEVAEGVLRIEAFNPVLRTEACRLLGKAHAARGQLEAACAAAERAAAEAAKARYVWLEMRSYRDLLQWSEKGAAANAAKARLDQVLAKLSTSDKEIEALLGDGAQSV